MYKKRKQYRLYGYDYSSNGFYFVTIVTKNRIHYFGKIENNKMNLSDIGKIILSYINKFLIGDNEEPNTQNPYLQNPQYQIDITEYAILPNHIHLIVKIINKTNFEPTTIKGLSPLLKGSLSSFINQFKGRTKRQCIENNFAEFCWQARFHDRIIRDNTEHSRIINYIQNNVRNWQYDSENIR